MIGEATAYGLRFRYPARDSTIGYCLARYGEFARSISDFMIEHATGDSGTFIDAGANVGAICLPFAKARPNWRVIGVEAHRGIAGLLSANAISNGLQNVTVVQAAVGPARCIAEFPDAPLGEERNFGTLSLSNQGGHSTAPTLMLPLDEIAPADTRLIKMDLEGYDGEALKGAAHLISDVRPIWLVEAAANHPEAAAEVIETFKRAGYAVHWFYAPFAGIDALERKGDGDAVRGDANVVAFPPDYVSAWRLPAVNGSARPGYTGAYPYLARYGFAVS